MASDEVTALDAAKAQFRKRAKARRAVAAEAAPDAGPRLARNFLDAIDPAAGTVVSVFWPLPGELDTQPLMEALIARDCQVVLPVMQGAGRPLIFRAWQPGDRLVAAGFGTREPGPDKAERTPELVVAPLLAFDRAGYRLGYGGGFYDRTLAKLRAAAPLLSVGITFAGQEAPSVPHDDKDQALDWIVTEREAIRIT